MKNILFIEDRPSRRSLFLPNKLNDVETLNAIIGLEMPTGQNCEEIINQINNLSFEFEQKINLIIIHKSALSTQGFNYLNKSCKTKQIDLICFSGGISQVFYNNEDFQFLNINSADLYTKKLIPFIENYIQKDDTVLLELLNSNWRISYWLLLRQLIETRKIESENENEVDIDRLNNLDFKIKKISDLLNFELSREDINKNIEKILIQI